MVIFMLDDSCRKTGKGFVLHHEISVQIFNSNFPGSFHLLGKSGNAQASFVIVPGFFRRIDDSCIDESFFYSFIIFFKIQNLIFRIKVFINNLAVDDERLRVVCRIQDIRNFFIIIRNLDLAVKQMGEDQGKCDDNFHREF